MPDNTADGFREARVEVAPGVCLAVRLAPGSELGDQPGDHRGDLRGQGDHREGPAAGPSRPFLLVHGLASNARTWDGVALGLTRLGHPAAAVDQRGHGRSDRPDTGYDFERITEDLVAVIAALGLDRPVVVGQSWGGNVVLELAARAPGLIAGVACVDGGTIELSETFGTWEECAERLAPPRLVGRPATSIESYLRSAHSDWPETGIAGAMANFEIRADGTVAPWLTFERHMAILRALWEHRPSDRLAAIPVPVLLIPADTGDSAWTAAKRAATDRAARRLPISRVRWFAPADHDVQAQYPDELAAVLHEAVADGFFR